ncbi:putative pentatricopeptide repeat-containing protein At3g25970 isoform X2 [Aristolochia californica]|uniref:putative pentatricopeptide repeat-containing protein At3g25970 isoform X2 n=1 Tax=Aristolochia californica TaxID=171875 RepID=UPI0035DB228F
MNRKTLQCGSVKECRYYLLRWLHAVAFNSAAKTHCIAIKTEAFSDIYTANKLLTAYARCNAVQNACQLFDEMPLRDTVSWNSMITAYVDSEDYAKSLKLLKSMKRSGILCDQYTFGSILKGVAYSNFSSIGRQLHSIIVKTGLNSNVFSSSALVDMYAKCGQVQDAGKVFECMVERNVVTWNAMIGGHAQAGDSGAAFWLLNCMERDQVGVDEATFASLLTLLDDPNCLKLTSQVHGKIVKHGLASKTIVCNAIITAYSYCGSIESSEKVFHNMGNNRDLVTWNSMLAAYVQQNCGLHAIELFIKMNQLGIKQDTYTYTSAISACFEPQQQRQGKALHGLVAKTGLELAISVSNALIAMYLKTDKCMTDAIRLFNFMDVKDSVSWNSILTGFSQNSLSEEALQFFSWMRSASIVINQYSLSAVFQSCSDMAILQLGQQVHTLATKLGFEQNDFVASSMIFMYSKCGVVDDARKLFNESNKNVSISWNSIIFGYAQYGQGTTALHLFSQMLDSGVKPDHITFVGIISACSHVGLIEEVDLLGRAGCLDDAKALIESMPYEPDAMVWKSLLGACRIHGNIELASYAAKYLETLDPQEHSTYLILSDLYARSGRWNERAMAKRVMRNKGLRKVPGWSWIEVNNKVHSFNAEDQSHPQVKDIYETLGELMLEIERWGYVTFDDSNSDEEGYCG